MEYIFEHSSAEKTLERFGFQKVKDTPNEYEIVLQRGKYGFAMRRYHVKVFGRMIDMHMDFPKGKINKKGKIYLGHRGYGFHVKVMQMIKRMWEYDNKRASLLFRVKNYIGIA